MHPPLRRIVSRPTAVVALGVASLGASLAATPAAAQPTHDPGRAAADWLADCRSRSRDRSWNRETACEVRDTTIAARSGRLAIDGGQNGGISVHGWDRNEIRVVARMQAQARSEADARDALRDVRIVAGPTIRADGPRSQRDDGWSVSFDVYVPRRSDLDLETHNGSIRVADVDGDIRLDAVNGSVRLANLAGTVRGGTDNGSVSVALSGDRWRGDGLDVRTQNGSVSVEIPERYNAELETGTVNGRFDLDFPVTVSGRLGRSITTRLGEGGARVRVTTQNGSVRLRRG